MNTEFLAVRAVVVCNEYEDGLREGSEGAATLAALGVFTRRVAPKTGTRFHYEIVAPSEAAAQALRDWSNWKHEHYAGCVRDGSGGEWDETRELISKRDAFARVGLRIGKAVT